MGMKMDAGREFVGGDADTDRGRSIVGTRMQDKENGDRKMQKDIW